MWRCAKFNIGHFHSDIHRTSTFFSTGSIITPSQQNAQIVTCHNLGWKPVMVRTYMYVTENHTTQRRASLQRNNNASVSTAHNIRHNLTNNTLPCRQQRQTSPEHQVGWNLLARSTHWFQWSVVWWRDVTNSILLQCGQCEFGVYKWQCCCYVRILSRLCIQYLAETSTAQKQHINVTKSQPSPFKLCI